MKPLKKIVSLIIAFNLLFSVAGVAKYVHYCGDEFFASSYFTKTTCCCGDEDEEDGCCKNEVTVMQLKNDCVSAEKSSLVKPTITATIFILNTVLFKATVATDNNAGLFLKADHKYHSPPLYLKNRVFLI